MKYLITLMVILLFTRVNSQNAVSDYFVCDISQNSTLSITATDLNKLAKEYIQNSNITEFKVQKVADHYVLLAKDIAQKLILVFELKSEGTKLYIDIDKKINACESQTLSVSIFKVVDGKIDGCFKGDLKTFSRY